MRSYDLRKPNHTASRIKKGELRQKSIFPIQFDPFGAYEFILFSPLGQFCANCISNFLISFLKINSNRIIAQIATGPLISLQSDTSNILIAELFLLINIQLKIVWVAKAEIRSDMLIFLIADFFQKPIQAPSGFLDKNKEGPDYKNNHDQIQKISRYLSFF